METLSHPFEVAPRMQLMTYHPAPHTLHLALLVSNVEPRYGRLSDVITF